MDNNCLIESLVYKATVDNGETYTGITGGKFKTRFTAHNASFRHKEKQHETKLSTHVWELKDQGKNPEIKWECLTTAPSYSPAIGRCILCIKEKETILYFREHASLNSRNEIVSICRHRKKFYLL